MPAAHIYSDNILASGACVYSAGAPPPQDIEAASGHWQAPRNTAMHLYIRMHRSALAPSPSRPGQSHKPSANKRSIPTCTILRRNVSFARFPASLLITSRGIQQTTRLSPALAARELLSCSTRRCRGSVTDRAGALAGSWQERHAAVDCHAARCTSAVTLTPRSPSPSSNKPPIPPCTILRRNVSLARSPTSLLVTSRGMQHHSRPSHHTTQSNKPLYTCREQHPCLSPAPQLTQVVALVAPVAPEYVPAQQRDG
jgi:hypothetical protein